MSNNPPRSGLTKADNYIFHAIGHYPIDAQGIIVSSMYKGIFAKKNLKIFATNNNFFSIKIFHYICFGWNFKTLNSFI